MIHLAYPRHLVSSLQILSYTLRCNRLLYQTIKHFLSLSVNIGEITVELTADLQAGEKNPLVFSQIIQVPLPPYTDTHWFFLR